MQSAHIQKDRRAGTVQCTSSPPSNVERSACNSIWSIRMNLFHRANTSVLWVTIVALASISCAAQVRRAWGPLTSGPFYTGTADADPPQSGYVEPFFFDSLTSSLGQTNLSMPQRVSFGIINNLEIDFYAPSTTTASARPARRTVKSKPQPGWGTFTSS